MGGGSVLSLFDVSRWQAGAYAGGGGFAGGIAKATEGVGFKDPAYDRHIAAIRAHPELVSGAYDYCRYDLGNSPEAEADWLLAVVGDPRGMLLAPDIEAPGFNGPLADWRARFLARLASRLSGYQAPWYSFRNYIATHALNTAQTTWCWLAWPDSNGPLPSLLVPIRMQQYGLVSVPGIVGSVDANRFFGTAAELRALTVGGAAAGPRRRPVRGEDAMGNLIPYEVPVLADGTVDPKSTQPLGEVYAADGEAVWGVWGGAAGQMTSYKGALTSLGSPEGAKDLVDANGAHAYHQGVLRLHVRGVRKDGSRWLAVYDAHSFADLQPWKLMPSPPLQYVPGDEPGPAGPPGPPANPDDVVDVIRQRLAAKG